MVDDCERASLGVVGTDADTGGSGGGGKAVSGAGGVGGGFGTADRPGGAPRGGSLACSSSICPLSSSSEDTLELSH